MQDYRFDLELQIIRFHEINSNSNTCHCTAQVTTLCSAISMFESCSHEASWFVGCVFWLKGVTQPGLQCIILHSFQSFRFQTLEQTKCNLQPRFIIPYSSRAALNLLWIKKNCTIELKTNLR